MAGGAWKRMGRVNGSDAGRKAKPVWLCDVCLCWHDDRDAKGKLVKPLECKFCHRTEFAYFHSSGEAQAWAALHRRARAGEVRNLRRQVPIDLLTVGKQGLACVWGQLVIDFTFEELQKDGSWLPVSCDYKPSEGMSPDAALKIRCLELMDPAQGGRSVRIITAKGEV